jgi:hypothetical protein
LNLCCAGNIDVQRDFIRLLAHRKDVFLHSIATRIERARAVAALIPDTGARERRKRRQRVPSPPQPFGDVFSAGAGSFAMSPSHTVGPGFDQLFSGAGSPTMASLGLSPVARSPSSFGTSRRAGSAAHARGGGLPFVSDAQIANAEALFKLLQRMTEGHFAPMQVRCCTRAGMVVPQVLPGLSWLVDNTGLAVSNVGPRTELIKVPSNSKINLDRDCVRRFSRGHAHWRIQGDNSRSRRAGAQHSCDWD